MTPYLIAGGLAAGIVLLAAGWHLEARSRRHDQYPPVPAPDTLDRWKPPTLG